MTPFPVLVPVAQTRPLHNPCEVLSIRNIAITTPTDMNSEGSAEQSEELKPDGNVATSECPHEDAKVRNYRFYLFFRTKMIYC
jgi:hypothetical protein